MYIYLEVMNVFRDRDDIQKLEELVLLALKTGDVNKRDKVSKINDVWTACFELCLD